MPLPLLRRFLQRKFDEAGPAAVALVLPEVLANLIELMMDPFGNYLVQKMLDRCNEDQRLEVGTLTLYSAQFPALQAGSGVRLL